MENCQNPSSPADQNLGTRKGDAVKTFKCTFLGVLANGWDMNKSSAPFKRAYTSSSKDLPRGKRRKVEYYADSSMRQKVVERLVEILQINVTVSVSVKDIRNVAEDIESCLFDYSGHPCSGHPC
eukprot:1105420-Amorphochlora_amoeboformis.AAC.2